MEMGGGEKKKISNIHLHMCAVGLKDDCNMLALPAHENCSAQKTTLEAPRPKNLRSAPYRLFP